MDNSMDERIGANVARLRGGKSQRETASEMRQLGWKWSHVTLVSIESGERPLRLAEAVDLAKVLHTDVRLLIEPVGSLAWNEAYIALDKTQRAWKDAASAYVQQVAQTVSSIADVPLTEEQEQSLHQMASASPIRLMIDVLENEAIPWMESLFEIGPALDDTMNARIARVRELLKPILTQWAQEAELVWSELTIADRNG